MPGKQVGIQPKCAAAWIGRCVAVLLACQTSAQCPSPTAQKPPFPVAASTLLEMRDARDVPRMRAHAWDLWAMLTKGGSPAWDQWDDKCTLKTSSSACPAHRAHLRPHEPPSGLEIPQQLLHEIATTARPGQLAATSALQMLVKAFQANPNLAMVLYNPAAAKHIRDQHLFDEKVLNRLLQERLSSPPSEREIPPFPEGSIVIKTAWEVLAVQGKEAGPLYLPSDAKLQLVQKGVDPVLPLTDFDRQPNVDLTPDLACDDKDYSLSAKIPLDCFYYYEFKSNDDVQRINRDVGGGAIGTLVTVPAIAVLVGVHVTTKEIADWTWSTFWWSPDLPGSHDPCVPATITGKWRRFRMETTLSDTTPREPLPDGGRKIIFNPFLENVIPNGMISNCMRCHALAVFPAPVPLKDAYALGARRRDDTPAGCNAPDRRTCEAPNYFDQSLKLDFLWSLQSKHDPAIKAFLQALTAK